MWMSTMVRSFFKRSPWCQFLAQKPFFYVQVSSKKIEIFQCFTFHFLFLGFMSFVLVHFPFLFSWFFDGHFLLLIFIFFLLFILLGVLSFPRDIFHKSSLSFGKYGIHSFFFRVINIFLIFITILFTFFLCILIALFGWSWVHFWAFSGSNSSS